MSLGGKIGVALGLVALVGGSYACGSAVREHDINECRARGGQPITRPVWSEDYYKVTCVEPTQGIGA